MASFIFKSGPLVLFLLASFVFICGRLVRILTSRPVIGRYRSGLGPSWTYLAVVNPIIAAVHPWPLCDRSLAHVFWPSRFMAVTFFDAIFLSHDDFKSRYSTFPAWIPLDSTILPYQPIKKKFSENHPTRVPVSVSKHSFVDYQQSVNVSHQIWECDVVSRTIIFPANFCWTFFPGATRDVG